jgi:hypothetical protein
MNIYGSARRALFVSAALVLFGALAVGVGTGRMHAAPVAVPANLVPPEGHVLQRVLLGIGAQVYTCRASVTAPSRYEWTFTAPSAVLLDDAGAIAGTHYAGPTWLGNDGSNVAGAVIERAPSPDPDAIPWLLLRGAAADTPGDFGSTTYIQRLDTAGGMAPKDGCDEEHAGAVARVPYTAVYVFFGAP